MNTSGHAAADVRDDAAGLRLAPFRGLRYVPERVGSLAAVTSPPTTSSYDLTDYSTWSRPTRTTSSG